jgi:hypothetical protein
MNTDMFQMIRRRSQWIGPILIGSFLLSILTGVHPAVAQINQLPIPEPIPGSYGLQATKVQEPPVVGATITTPGNGSSFTTSPIAVSGICPTDLLVEVYNNSVLVGAVICKAGSFSVQVSLFAGINELTVSVYDELDQPGPPSGLTTVTYNDTRFTAFGELITLTSSFGLRSAAAGAELSWPLQLSGGTGPYAFSIDWGDGTASDLKSQTLAGLVTILHTYKKAGIYQLNVKVTDVNGVSAFLQLVALGNGKVAEVPSTEPATIITRVLWIPAVIALVLLIPTYWLGRRSQLVSLRNKLLKDQENYKYK